eukprot:scaffold7245_cov197-Ochromonas_danica.AAC.8
MALFGETLANCSSELLQNSEHFSELKSKLKLKIKNLAGSASWYDFLVSAQQDPDLRDRTISALICPGKKKESTEQCLLFWKGFFLSVWEKNSSNMAGVCASLKLQPPTGWLDNDGNIADMALNAVISLDFLISVFYGDMQSLLDEIRSSTTLLSNLLPGYSSNAMDQEIEEEEAPALGLPSILPNVSQGPGLSKWYPRDDYCIQIITGNLLSRDFLSKEKPQAIVNAANSALLHGGGIAAAIGRAAGRQLDEECRKWKEENGELEVGRDAAVTTAGYIPGVLKVIHVVGPQIQEGVRPNEAQ